MNTRQMMVQKEQVSEILEFLNEKRIRCTYGAVGYFVGVHPRLVNKYLLGDNRPEASWIVNSQKKDQQVIQKTNIILSSLGQRKSYIRGLS